jgi:ElaB/YqjD/DUF883 family membrane-anchored ribosome-binding protein
MENIRKSVDTLIKDGNKALEQVNDIAESAWEKGRETFKEVRHQGEEAIAPARRGAREAWDKTLKLVQEHPRKSIGLAVLAGVVIGAALLSMRKDS